MQGYLCGRRTELNGSAGLSCKLGSPRSGASRVFTRKRVFLVKSSVTILRTSMGPETAISPTTIRVAEVRVVRFVNFTSSKRLAALSTAIAFPQSGRRLPALHKTLRRQHLTEGPELQNDHVAYAVGIDNLPTVSSPCSWPTTATHEVMRSILIDDWIMEILSRHGDWLRVALDSWGISLYQLVGHPVKYKPPTLAACPAVLPQFFHKSTPLRRALRRGFRRFLQEKRVCA